MTPKTKQQSKRKRSQKKPKVELFAGKMMATMVCWLSIYCKGSQQTQTVIVTFSQNLDDVVLYSQKKAPVEILQMEDFR